MSQVSISAEPRTEFGKGAARRIRRAAKVPAVVYGHGEAPRHVALPGHELMLALKTSNVLLDLDLGGGERQLTLPRDVQRDPIKGFLEHVDLVVVRRGEKVVVDVPVTVSGEPTDGLLVVDTATLSVEAEATAIPAGFEVSVEGSEPGHQVHASDVPLPADVTLQVEPDTLVASITTAPSAEALEAELAAAEAEVGIVHETSEDDAAAAAASDTEPAAEGGSEGEQA